VSKVAPNEVLSKGKCSVSTAVDKIEPAWAYYVLFFVSGFPALLYQIVWERALFTIYGVNIQSVTVIVTIFMLGLGLGSLAGGKLSAIPGAQLLRFFGAIELSVGTFGAVSLWIFHRVASFTAGASLSATGCITFFLLLIPTLLMGSTLPLLVAHFVRRTQNVGESVSCLYSVNTLGSALACFAAMFFVMRYLGESGSVRLAASLNALVGITVLVLDFGRRDEFAYSPQAIPASEPPKAIPFAAGVFLAGAVGFISLAYEIVWYRVYSFTSGGAAPCFAELLALYLLGIGYGSFAVRDICRKLGSDPRQMLAMASKTVLFGSIAGFLVGPAVSFTVCYIPYDVNFAFVFIGAGLLGAAFPMLSHLAIDPAEQAGSKISYLYLANVMGSALGSFLVGFVIMNRFSMRSTSLLLLGLGVGVALVIGILANKKYTRKLFAMGFAACLGLALLSGPLFSKMYERLLFKVTYTPDTRLTDVVENRSGVIAVAKDETVFGGGVYDGHFNIDPFHDTNDIFRAYAIAGLHPHPKRVLIIGLSSGSWAQVVAHHPEVERVTIVEINPGYLPLIRRRASISSLLQNPKVDIVIDDGRRWLSSHPDRRFDFILMNTTFHWRANSSNLLSREFCELLRSHLKSGGIAYYNTTGSGEVQITGASTFPYALRVANFLAVSDSPINFNKTLWKSVLMKYNIDGRPVFDLSKPEHVAKLDQILALADETPQPRRQGNEIETRSELLARWQGFPLITDDNMGTEWLPPENR
jgi:spermidine synthase